MLGVDGVGEDCIVLLLKQLGLLMTIPRLHQVHRDNVLCIKVIGNDQLCLAFIATPNVIYDFSTEECLELISQLTLLRVRRSQIPHSNRVLVVASLSDLISQLVRERTSLGVSVHDLDEDL